MCLCNISGVILKDYTQVYRLQETVVAHTAVLAKDLAEANDTFIINLLVLTTQTFHTFTLNPMNNQDFSSGEHFWILSLTTKIMLSVVSESCEPSSVHVWDR